MKKSSVDHHKMMRSTSSSSSRSSVSTSSTSSLVSQTISIDDMSSHAHTSNRDIYHKPMKRVFFSPHPDDIAYSCFGTMKRKVNGCSCSSQTSMRANQKNRAWDCLGILTPPASPQVDKKDNYFSSPSSSLRSSRSPSPILYAAPMSVAYAMHRDTWGMYKPTIQARDEGLDLAGPRVTSSTSGDLIVTVFSTSRCANGEIGRALEHNVHKTSTLRAAEDEDFAREVNADLVWLGFPDSSARDEHSRRPELEVEALHGTPSSSCGKVDHPIFRHVRQALCPIVLQAVASQAKMYVPLGVGCHVDHWMVRVAVLSILDELVRTSVQDQHASIYSLVSFYEDLPYANQTNPEAIEVLAHAVLPNGAEPRLVPLLREEWDHKEALIRGYASQMKPTIVPSLFAHARFLATLGSKIDPSWARERRRVLRTATSSLHSREIVGAERIWVIPYPTSSAKISSR